MAGILDTIRSRVQDDPVAQYLADTYKGMGLLASDTTKNTWSGMDTLDRAALATSTVPVVGDVVGLANDARYLYQEPSLINAAMMGIGAIPLVPSLGMIKAYHGSPHKFDRFSMDSIGTGQGAQAYGYGLYFAENPKVAGEYANQLAKLKSENAWDEVIGPIMQKHNIPLSHWESRGDDAVAGRLLNNYGDRLSDAEKLQIESVMDKHIYNVKIDVEPEDLLDWDAPLSEQSESVKKAFYEFANSKTGKFAADSLGIDDIKKMTSPYGGEPTGEDIYAFMYEGYSGTHWDAERPEISKYLKEKGIPGIRYLDQGSRGKGEGTRNLVIFDDSLIEIVQPKKLLGK